MAEFTITCPWCTETSTHEADLARSIVLNAKELDEILKSKEDDPRFFRCYAPNCPAPIEAVICGNPEVAEEVRKKLRESWTVPKTSRLHLGRADVRLWLVTFNSSPVRWDRNHRISSLMDVEFLQKALLGFAVAHQVPVALFEAHPAGGKIHWLRLPPASSPGGGMAFQYNPLCKECRAVFQKRVDSEIKDSPCAYGDECPYCSSDEPREPWNTRIDRCLTTLKERQQYSLCHNSDLRLIHEVEGAFKKSTSYTPQVVVDVCWRKATELALPVVVHNHLSAVVLTGQFLVDCGTPTPDQLEESEAIWRRDHSMSETCLLPGGRDKIDALLGGRRVESKPFSERSVPPPEGVTRFITATREEIRRLAKDLADDVKNIQEVANNRYLQHKDRTESAFRAELSGTLLRNLLDGKEFPDFLMDILRRMREFWAFERVALAMGSDIDDTIVLYSTDTEYMANREDPCRIPVVKGLLEGISSFPFAPKGKYASESIAFAKKVQAPLDKLYEEEVIHREEQCFVTIVLFGNRQYFFAFGGRDEKLLSRLPFRSLEGPMRLSKEAQVQIETTCRKVAEDLHHFWFKEDQEHSYRAFAHSLRGPASVMSNPVGVFARLLYDEREQIQPLASRFYDSAWRLVESVRVGALILDGELDRLASVGALDQRIENARDGVADLIPILAKLKKAYEFYYGPDDKKWVGNEDGFATLMVKGKQYLVDLVLHNVIDNAFKYSYRRLDVVIRLRKCGSRVRILVANYGTAIEPGEFNLIFHRGYRGTYARKRLGVAAEGSGLGMYLVRRVMDALEGSVKVGCRRAGMTGESASRGLTMTRLVLEAFEREDRDE